MSSRRSVGDPEYLTRRIPQNPRYQHIKTRLDTGCSLTKYIEKLEEIKRKRLHPEAQCQKIQTELPGQNQVCSIAFGGRSSSSSALFGDG
uniref:Centrosomal protein 41 n=1 Tax=Chrysolophus pictus TaxID=9089 RepID=A0A8C3LZM2_CHRPC